MSKPDMSTTIRLNTLKSSGPLAMTPPTGNRSRELTLLRRMPKPLSAFSFIHLLHHHGKLASVIPPSQHLNREDISEKYVEALRRQIGLPEYSEIWPLVLPLGVTQEKVDAFAQMHLPGYIFVSRLLSLDDDDGLHSPVTVCTDLVLTTAVIARTKGHYYRSDTPPNYRIDHFLKTAVVCGDSWISELATAAKQEEAQ